MADPIAKALIAFALLASLLLCLQASSDVPFIVAHKKASLNRLKSGAERVSVTIDIYNQGTSTAYDVSLSDDSWPSDAFDVISGSTSKSWERLDAGGIISHTFELEAKSKGVFAGEPAVIKFRVPTKAALQLAKNLPCHSAIAAMALPFSNTDFCFTIKIQRKGKQEEALIIGKLEHLQSDTLEARS
ncbi:hypothetical protein JHK82_053175 [Glycine max]|nr:hypothetical protein JHK86_053022 [Glycine max]KAG5085778.1 hypothetical protein JHK82_053175 [Glycine max]